MVLNDLWTSVGVILGFQMTLFSWRLSEEAKVGDEGDIPWLTPSDYMNIMGMLVFTFGVYLLPILGIIDMELTKIFFALGVIFFVGQALGTAAHYQLFNRTQKKVFVWFPLQEKIVLVLFGFLSVSFFIIAVLRLK